MTISLTINATDANDLRRQLADLLGSAAVIPTIAGTFVASGVGAPGGAGGATSATKPKVVAGTDTEPKVEETKAAAEVVRPKVETKTEETVAEPEVEVEETQADAGEPTEVVYTYDDHIKPSVLKVSAKHGRPGVEKLLSQFGVANAREVPEEKWPEFMAEIEKLLG